MKFVGHTMAVPGMPTAEAIALFAGIGMHGIELAARENLDFHLDMSGEQLAAIREASRQSGLPVVTITPYMWQINHPEEAERAREVAGLLRAVDIAAFLGARFVRAYGGSDKFGPDPVHFDRTVESLRTAGDYAAGRGVTVVVENHPGTLTPSGALTSRMVKAVGSDHVKALFDPANALHAAGEDPMVTLDTQRDIIAYVHCKDYFMQGDKRRACCVGEGIVPWKPIMKGLKALSYDGYLCFEYEKMWYPEDLEAAKTGLPKCTKYIMEALNE